MRLSPLIFLPFLPFLLLLPPTTNATPTPTPNPPSLSTHTHPKRAPATHLPGGWTFTLSTASTFSNPTPATTALATFYHFALTSLYDPAHSTLSTRALSISDEIFELLFRVRDRWMFPEARVPIFMVRQFVTLMQYRTRRGLAAQYQGWLRGPGGVVVDVVLETIPARLLLDSAMDLYGDP
ncbi:MAG: hypothetical protein LQ339_006974 [Xanthoria mediterranea]|nr:MAG: hypothetical protein LQ339_006974 [Xanthoria mediterranea]